MGQASLGSVRLHSSEHHKNSNNGQTTGLSTIVRSNRRFRRAWTCGTGLFITRGETAVSGEPGPVQIANWALSSSRERNPAVSGEPGPVCANCELGSFFITTGETPPFPAKKPPFWRALQTCSQQHLHLYENCDTCVKHIGQEIGSACRCHAIGPKFSQVIRPITTICTTTCL